ncbi:uracil-DNA glycosylase [Lignipirellula cremea]|uniref:Uracil-DNA glycosylase n=1 Tax=Lignipirellula cremea TaxID=2528010 RepID=A0A518E2E3_9BACT|nr:uracil-DNA glycosylase [Lignipirellula cremea]QDU98222.1 Uracil-DNA glycosylase [Lignipirellula cremea]
MQIPPGWRDVLAAETELPRFQQLQEFLAAERAEHEIYPPAEDVLNALAYTPYNDVQVVLLGQDPYHGPGQAHGLCFSVKRGVAAPPSLRNMLKELAADQGCSIPTHGELTAWARQGVLLLNTVLTVRRGEANSHKNQGWEEFTDAIIRRLNDRPRPVVFALWGGFAQKKAKLIDASRHPILTTAHPSPLSAKKFHGSRPFSAINHALTEQGQPAIDWQIPEIAD